MSIEVFKWINFSVCYNEAAAAHSKNKRSKVLMRFREKKKQQKYSVKQAFEIRRRRTENEHVSFRKVGCS